MIEARPRHGHRWIASALIVAGAMAGPALTMTVSAPPAAAADGGAPDCALSDTDQSCPTPSTPGSGDSAPAGDGEGDAGDGGGHQSGPAPAVGTIVGGWVLIATGSYDESTGLTHDTWEPLQSGANTSELASAVGYQLCYPVRAGMEWDAACAWNY